MIVASEIVRAKDVETLGVFHKRPGMEIGLLLLVTQTAKITTKTNYSVVDHDLSQS